MKLKKEEKLIEIMSNSEITNFYMVVSRLFTIVPANESIYVTMVPSRTVRPANKFSLELVLFIYSQKSV